MNLLLFGAPGTGKGTQAELLVSTYRLCLISTGNLLRSAIQQKSALGIKALSYMDKGQLVPDSLVINLIKKKVEVLKSKDTKATQKGLILDGFPRTLAQAKALDILFKDLKCKLSAVFYLKVPNKILIERITGRRLAKKSGLVYHIKFRPPKNPGFCDKTGEKLIQRSDDSENVAQKRLQTYEQATYPLIDYYRQKNLLHTLNGEGSVTQVFSRIKKVLSTL